MARTFTSLPVLAVALLQPHCHVWTSILQSSSTWPPHRLPSKLAAMSHSGSTHDTIPNAASSRQGFFNKVSSRAAPLFILSLSGCLSPSFAQEDDSDLIDVYFGCAESLVTNDTFQHDETLFVIMSNTKYPSRTRLLLARPTRIRGSKQRILSRPDTQLTSRAGYAGGKSSVNGKVCYHNAANIADYGSLGHVVVMSSLIPPPSILRRIHRGLL
ncbi:hypothetical protein HJC23_011893 [Cyclotella cryptica]|uniref:Uncharacterized protein n=1 Tax=Cyclotella cryptica TaxID=29204 RepID=A0ABD3PKD7_9STRA